MLKFMMQSKLLREEIKTWIGYASLTLWALLATFFALKNNQRTLLIGMDESGARVISTNTDKLAQSELKNFLKEFITTYYNYNDKTYLEQMSKATDLMSNDLFNRKKEEINNLRTKLQNNPLTQTSEIEDIDLTNGGHVQATLAITVVSRLIPQKVKLRCNIEFKKSERSEQNPWGYTITEVSDATF